MSSEIDSVNMERHESVVKLLPEESMYVLLWGSPEEEGKKFSLHALGNIEPEVRLKICVEFIREEIKKDVTGKLERIFMDSLMPFILASIHRELLVRGNTNAPN